MYSDKLSLSIKGIPKPRSSKTVHAHANTIKTKYALRHFIKLRDKVDGLLNGSYIECEICGILLGQLSGHVVKKHGITIDQYKKMFLVH